jgi:hypothetical protein
MSRRSGENRSGVQDQWSGGRREGAWGPAVGRGSLGDLMLAQGDRRSERQRM